MTRAECMDLFAQEVRLVDNAGREADTGCDRKFIGQVPACRFRGVERTHLFLGYIEESIGLREVTRQLERPCTSTTVPSSLVVTGT